MTVIEIAQMPVAEKLKLMEALWDSLSGRPGDNFSSPAWHEQALNQAKGELATGNAQLVDWAEAKEQLRGRGRV